VWCGDEASHRAPFDAVSEAAPKSRATEVVSIANSWAAELGGDTVSLKEILADDFVEVGPRGLSLTREQWIARHEAENLKYGSFGLDEAEVRTYGDAAIVVCRQTAAGVYGYENGRYEIDERFRGSAPAAATG
jgi:hypothetical protein